jgi:hypothetical protein
MFINNMEEKQWRGITLKTGSRLAPSMNQSFMTLFREGMIAPHDLVWNTSMGEEWRTTGQ